MFRFNIQNKDYASSYPKNVYIVWKGVKLPINFDKLFNISLEILQYSSAKHSAETGLNWASSPNLRIWPKT